MLRLAALIDAVNRRVGRAAALCALGLVLAEFGVVILRYVFGVGLIGLQEAATYQHGFLIVLGAGFALLTDEHVRVDILYGGMSPRRRALVDLLGVVFLLLPFCWVLWAYAFPYVAQSWRILEGSRENSGLPFLYILKSGLLAFALLLALQAVSLAMKSLDALRRGDGA